MLSVNRQVGALAAPASNTIAIGNNAQRVGRVSRRRNPPSWRIGVGGLRFANPPYVLRAPNHFARQLSHHI